jgi:hypothetical protein
VKSYLTQLELGDLHLKIFAKLMENLDIFSIPLMYMDARGGLVMQRVVQRP